MSDTNRMQGPRPPQGGPGRAGWVRVNRRRRCPLCGSVKWCLLAVNGSAVICPKTADGATCDLGAAGYLHRGDFSALTGGAP